MKFKVEGPARSTAIVAGTRDFRKRHSSLVGHGPGCYFPQMQGDALAG